MGPLATQLDVFPAGFVEEGHNTEPLARVGNGKLSALPTALLGRSVRVEQVSRYPLAFRICGLLSQSECAHIISLSMQRMMEAG